MPSLSTRICDGHSSRTTQCQTRRLLVWVYGPARGRGRCSTAHIRSRIRSRIRVRHADIRVHDRTEIAPAAQDFRHGITGLHHPTQPDMYGPTHCRQQRRIVFDASHRTHTSFGGGMRTLERPSPVGAHRARMRVRVECAELRFRATRSDRPGTPGATSDSLCSVLPAGNLAGYGTGKEGRQSEAAT